MSPFTRYDALYGAGIALAFLCAGLYAPHALNAHVHGLQATALWTLLCIVAIALIAGYFRHLRMNSPAKLRPLLRDAHQHVVRLTDAGYSMLAPCESDHATARLLIRMDGERAVIEKELWRGMRHYYVISPSGEVTREIFGDAPTRTDRQWLNSPLTYTRLAYLVQALQLTYSPRRRVSSDA